MSRRLEKVSRNAGTVKIGAVKIAGHEGRRSAMIEMKCPHCGHQLRIADKYAGRKGGCKHCRGSFQVPHRDLSQSPVAVAPTKPMRVPIEPESTSLDSLRHRAPGPDEDLDSGLESRSSGAGPAGAFTGNEQSREAMESVVGLGCFFWGLAFFFPPVAFFWALFGAKGHPHRLRGIGVPVAMMLFAAGALGVGFLLSPDTEQLAQFAPAPGGPSPDEESYLTLEADLPPSETTAFTTVVESDSTSTGAPPSEAAAFTAARETVSASAGSPWVFLQLRGTYTSQQSISLSRSSFGEMEYQETLEAGKLFRVEEAIFDAAGAKWYHINKAGPEGTWGELWFNAAEVRADALSAVPPQWANQGPLGDVPLYPGMQLTALSELPWIYRFQDVNPDLMAGAEGTAQADAKTVEQFYKNELPNRGWFIEGFSSGVSDDFMFRGVTAMKGDLGLNLKMFAQGAETKVVIVTGPLPPLIDPAPVPAQSHVYPGMTVGPCTSLANLSGPLANVDPRRLTCLSGYVSAGIEEVESYYDTAYSRDGWTRTGSVSFDEVRSFTSEARNGAYAVFVHGAAEGGGSRIVIICAGN